MQSCCLSLRSKTLDDRETGNLIPHYCPSNLFDFFLFVSKLFLPAMVVFLALVPFSCINSIHLLKNFQHTFVIHVAINFFSSLRKCVCCSGFNNFNSFDGIYVKSSLLIRQILDLLWHTPLNYCILVCFFVLFSLHSLRANMNS